MTAAADAFGLRVVLAGDEAAGSRAMTMLERSPHQLVAVAAKSDGSDSRRSMWARAEAAGHTCIEARRLGSSEVVAELELLEPDVLLNVHSLYKVHASVLAVFRIGAWNLHPGPLPSAAGINVPSWAIADGHNEHGVTVHAMTENYDEGAIAYAERFAIKPDATGLTLSAECGSRGLALIKRLLDQLADDPGGVPRKPQDLARRHLYPLGQPNDGIIDWTAPAEEIAAHVRAADFRPFSGPWSPPIAQIGTERRQLHEVHVEDTADGPPGHVQRTPVQLRVASADRWVRIIDSEVVPC